MIPQQKFDDGKPIMLLARAGHYRAVYARIFRPRAFIMFEILFLGTSASAPSVHRGLAANLVMHQEHRFLVDCGEGTQRQILQSGCGFKRLDKILITHGHLDHILGLGGLLSTLTRWEAVEKVEIWAGKSALERIRDLLFQVVFRGERAQFNIELIPLETGVVFDNKLFSVHAFPVSHRGPDCFGFVFEEKEHRPFLNDRADALNVPFGPERSQLVRGLPVTLAGGRLVLPEDVLGPVVSGTKLVYVGDAGRTDNLVEYCQSADALAIEATYIEQERDLAKNFQHLTAQQAATLAAQSGVQQLLLTHVSRRYRERDILAEAQAVFPNVSIARDMDQVQVRRRADVSA